MISQKEKKDCCGCRACEQACPFYAIHMEPDEKGFLYPVIDMQKCKDCGLCDKVCGFTEQNPYLSSMNPNFYAAKHVSEDVRAKSTSGGAFTAISDEVLRQNGVVFGAAYTDNLSVVHIRAENIAERDRLRNSKYVQSDINTTYVQAQKELKEGRLVLFTGTPCQIASLHTFLHKNYENLMTVDIVCHGVPSNMLWMDFLKLVQKKTGHKVVAANHREKAESGWHHPQTVLKFDDGKEHFFHGTQSFFQLFNTNLCLRPSCLKCKFLTYARPSDITIADYWGIERFRKDFDDNKGTSMILLNTQKGKVFFEKVKSDLNCFPTDKGHCWQGRLQGRSTIHPDTDKFWKEYQAKGLEYVLVKYTDYSQVRLFFKKVKRRLGMILGKGAK